MDLSNVISKTQKYKYHALTHQWKLIHQTQKKAMQQRLKWMDGEGMEEVQNEALKTVGLSLVPHLAWLKCENCR